MYLYIFGLKYVYYCFLNLIGYDYDYPKIQFSFRRFVFLSFDAETMQIKGVRLIKAAFAFTVRLISNVPLFEHFSDTMADLTGSDKVSVIDAIDPLHVTNETVSDTVGSYGKVYLLVPEDLRRAFEGDVHRLEKKRGKLEAELQKIQRIVSAEAYQINVSENVKESNLKKVCFLTRLIFLLAQYKCTLFT